MSVPQPSASASYPERARQFAKLFWPLTEAASSVMITGHENPDDDSIGSVMAMYEILKTKYPEKKIDIQYPEPMGDRWHTFSTFKEIKTTKDMNAAVSRYELVIFLDGSEYFRFRLDSTKVDVGGRKTVCIDHHSNAPDTFDLSLLEPKATSVSELIYYAVCESASQLSQNVIESLLLGIFGDTLMFDWVGPDQTPVFAAVARLMQEGNIISNEFRARYSTYSERVFTLLQEFVKQAKIQRISSWPPFLGSIVSRAFVSKGQYADEETSAASHRFINTYGRSLTGIRWGMSIYPRGNGEVRISARSMGGGANVRLLLEGMGIGGGHGGSSGGTFKPNPAPREPEQCLNEIIAWMETHEPVVVEEGCKSMV